MNDFDTAELRMVANRLLLMAEERSSARPVKTHPPGQQGLVDDRMLAQIAERELIRRGLRSNFLPADLFGEGGWAILLDLFVNEQRASLVSVKSACIASDVPATTALRYIAALIESNLVIRTDCSSDRRVKYLRLTPTGRDALRAALHHYVD